MYYHGFSHDYTGIDKMWTGYDDNLVTMLFTKIINKTANTGKEGEELTSEMVNNLFDLCFYINKDVKEC